MTRVTYSPATHPAGAIQGVTRISYWLDPPGGPMVKTSMLVDGELRDDDEAWAKLSQFVKTHPFPNRTRFGVLGCCVISFGG